MLRVALLRGINVGPSTRVPMAELRAALQREGVVAPRTHLQSGNVLFDAAGDDDAARELVRRAVHAVAGLDVDVVLRTPEELVEVVAADPLGAEADDPSRRLVVFLDVPIVAGALDEVVGTDWGAERLVVRERELVLWCPGGVRDSPLGRALARIRTGGVATTRNWRTTVRLAELAAG